ncbi:hypothetical protein [Streptomyces lydicus]|uniref:hypothetical protein n=1 Tax=Streptomyces lydicus TaxID=47763 RepID=UPI0036F084CB
MTPHCPTPPPYGATPVPVLAPPRAEDRLSTLAFPAGFLLPPPRPEDRLPLDARAEDPPLFPPGPEEHLQGPVALPDRQRPDLRAALVAAGVAPSEGDQAALAELAGLGDATLRAVVGWLEAAARASWQQRPQAV